MSAEPLTQGERDRALSHFHSTRKLFLDVASSCSGPQWSWKPAADKWSLAEVAEHIALSEETLYQAVLKATQGPAEPARRAEVKIKDEVILRVVPNRDRKVQAPEMLKPRSTFAGKEAAVDAFRKARDRNIAFVRETGAPLRDHFAPHPALGLLDAYQWLIFISAHSERHILQMKEVMATAGYPAA